MEEFKKIYVEFFTSSFGDFLNCTHMYIIFTALNKIMLFMLLAAARCNL